MAGKEPTMVVGAADVESAVAVTHVAPEIASMATSAPHKVAREYALGAAKICESSMLQPAAKANARRLLAAALALLGE